MLAPPSPAVFLIVCSSLGRIVPLLLESPQCRALVRKYITYILRIKTDERCYQQEEDFDPLIQLDDNNEDPGQANDFTEEFLAMDVVLGVLSYIPHSERETGIRPEANEFFIGLPTTHWNKAGGGGRGLLLILSLL